MIYRQDPCGSVHFDNGLGLETTMIYRQDPCGSVHFDSGLGLVNMPSWRPQTSAPVRTTPRLRMQGRAGNAPGVSACIDQDLAAMSAASTGDADFYRNFQSFGRGAIRTCAQQHCSFVARLPTDRAARNYCDKLSAGGYVCCR